MDAYELRSIENGFELHGGKLQEPLIYRESEPSPAIHLVGFLSQRDGSELRRHACAIGGLAGPS